MDKTFVMLKPDAVQRNIVGKIISRFEDKGYYISAMKMLMISKQQAEDLYAEHKGKDFYDALIDFTTASQAVVMVIQGIGEVAADVKWFVGKDKNDKGTIRGDLCVSDTNRNVVHTSDKESAEREIAIFFSKDELGRWCKRCDEDVIYSDKDWYNE